MMQGVEQGAERWQSDNSPGFKRSKFKLLSKSVPSHQNGWATKASHQSEETQWIIPTHYFKMEGVHMLNDLLRKGNSFTENSLKDASFIIPNLSVDRACLHFSTLDHHFQFTYIPLGLWFQGFYQDNEVCDNPALWAGIDDTGVHTCKWFSTHGRVARIGEGPHTQTMELHHLEGLNSASQFIPPGHLLCRVIQGHLAMTL